jgi:catechol 2,3-dioxygenase-like lactoylglutathione lyase family enzyme
VRDGAHRGGRIVPNVQLADGIVSLRPFLPARDFQVSKRFYADLGFELMPLGDKLVHVGLGTFAFLLQDCYIREWAENVAMHMLVDDLDPWWESIDALRLESRYGVRAPKPPKVEPWGLRVAYVFDPSGVLWHFAEEAECVAVRRPSMAGPARLAVMDR